MFQLLTVNCISISSVNPSSCRHGGLQALVPRVSPWQVPGVCFPACVWSTALLQAGRSNELLILGCLCTALDLEVHHDSRLYFGHSLLHTAAGRYCTGTALEAYFEVLNHIHFTITLPRFTIL